MFDCVVGNPPYGRNANLAVRFLNLTTGLTDTTAFVLPKSFSKASIVNRVDPSLHLHASGDVAPGVFPGTITACWQIWVRGASPRPPIQTLKVHPDFEFVSPPQADLALGRVGGGPCGRVYLDRLDQRSTNTHYFLRVRDPSVIGRLQSLESEFRSRGFETVGHPSLSKHDLISIYTECCEKATLT